MKCGESLFCPLREEVVSHGREKKPEYVMKTEMKGAEGTWLQQQSKKAGIKRKTMSETRQTFDLSMPLMPSGVKTLLET